MSGVSDMIGGVSQATLGHLSGLSQMESLQAQTAGTDTQLLLKAQQSREQGAFQAAKLRLMGSQLIARQQTAYAKSGVDTKSGTPLAVMADTRLMSEEDAKMAENNAARDAFGYASSRRTLASDYLAKRDQLDQARVGSILGGVAQFGKGLFSAGMSAGG